MTSPPQGLQGQPGGQLGLEHGGSAEVRVGILPFFSPPSDNVPP